MLELKPVIENHFECPECKAVSPLIKDVLMQPVNVLADCTCRECGFEFYQAFPVGHSVGNHLSIGKSAGKIYNEVDHSSWLSEFLLAARAGRRNGKVAIRKKIFKEAREVVVLNTLDYLYGHVLLKLYNAQHHLDYQKDLGLVVIIPGIFEWLVPQGCAEAWIVDLTLSELSSGYEEIQKFISVEFERFNKVYLSKAYSHPDCSAIDIHRFTGVRPFDLSRFYAGRPTVTFVLREDRWWLGSIVDYWVYRVCRRLNMMAWASNFLAHEQNRLVKRAIRSAGKMLPSVDFHIVGIGRTGRFSGWAEDHRATAMDRERELMWCQVCARSHVVVGVHGSNMLLPTALAAGCVEILPHDRNNNLVQDISVRYRDRKQLFFYRFVDQYASPRSVAAKVAAIVKDFDQFNKTMCINIYKTPRASAGPGQ